MKTKTNLMKLMSALVLALFAFSALVPAVSLGNPATILGHDFSEPAFALEIDFNAELGTALNDIPSGAEVVRDFTNPNNPLVRTSDGDENRDQQFFLAYMNQSGIETAYLALEKIEFDVNVTDPILGQTHRLFHVNGTMPFQSLFQHYTFNGSDVFILNQFNGLFAYTTSVNDPLLDPNDKVWFGYTLAEQHLLNFLNTSLSNHGLGTIPQWNVEASFSEISSVGAESAQVSSYEWSMTYKNLLVFWQEVTGAPSTVSQFSDEAAQMVVFGDIKAVTLLDSLTFGFKAQVVEANDTMVKVDIITEYDIGAISLAIVRDDQNTYNSLRSSYSDKINENNSFFQPASSYIIPSPVNGIGDIQINMPAFAVYKDVAARARVNATTIADGIGVGVLTSTNVYVADYTVSIPNPVEDGQDIELPLEVGGQALFETNFRGKSTYDRDESIDGGQVYTDLPAYIDVIPGDSVRVSNDLRAYFTIQRYMSNLFGLYMARMVSPVLNSALLTDLEGASINMRVQDTAYYTLLQMPEWNGYPLTQDPTFSAVSVVSTTGEGNGSESGGGGSGGAQPTAPIPGFELILALGALPLLLALRRSKIKNKQ